MLRGKPGGLFALAAFLLVLGAMGARPCRAQNLILNPGVETPDNNDPQVPEHWRTYAYGQNVATFSYDHTGHNSSRSVRLDVQNFVDGGACWQHEPVAVTPGKFYTFSAYLTGNIEARVVIRQEWTANSGFYGSGDSYQLKQAISSPAKWSKYCDTFFVPEGVSTVRVMFVAMTNGSLSVDDFSLEQTAYAVNSSRTPTVSIMADDNWANFKTNALPIMNQYGYKATFYIQTGRLGQPSMLNADDLIALRAAGHEIAAHTESHSDLSLLNRDDARNEIEESVDILNGILGGDFITDFATPLGGHSALVDDLLRDCGFDGMGQAALGSNRNLAGWYNYPENYSPLDIRTVAMKDTVYLPELRAILQVAKDNHLWVTLTYHQVANDSDIKPTGSTTVRTGIFRQQMALIHDMGFRVVVVDQALREFIKN